MPFIERKGCPICANNSYYTLTSIPYTADFIEKSLRERSNEKISHKDLVDVNYEILKCKKCEFCFQRYLADEHLSGLIYTNEGGDGSLIKKQKAGINDYLQEALLGQKVAVLLNKNPSEITVLEFGSGWGRFLLVARAHGYTVRGLEIQKERRDYSVSLGFDVKSFLYQLGETNFDFIHSDQTLEHVQDPLICLTDLVNRLRDDGLIYLAVPNCAKALKKIEVARQAIIPELYPLGHINCFTNKTLKLLASKAGLEPLPTSKIFQNLTGIVRPSRNWQFLQEGIKSLYSQNFSTGLYFRKRR